MIAVTGFFMNACDNGNSPGPSTYGGDNGGSNGGGGSNGSSTWLWVNEKNFYIISGDIVGMTSEYNASWKKYTYTNNKNWENEYSYTFSSNTHMEYETYTYSQIGSSQYFINSSRNGNTSQTITHSLTDTTTTYSYVNPLMEDNIAIINTDTTTSSSTLYDEESGLTLSNTITTTSKNNITDTITGPTTTEVNYTIDPLNTAADGSKIYKVTYSTNGISTPGLFSEYKVKNGVTLEIKTYTSDVLNNTLTYTYPENAIIREKLPDLRVYNSIVESNPALNTSQTAEVISDSSTELIVRIKRYRAGVLTDQTETTYKPISAISFK